jgi:predicted site-specific integrase-resolvase
VDTVWITTRDRLCRYGAGIIYKLAKLSGTKIVEIHSTPDKSDAEAVAESMLAVVNVFVARHNGKRAHFKRERERDESPQRKLDMYCFIPSGCDIGGC